MIPSIRARRRRAGIILVAVVVLIGGGLAVAVNGRFETSANAEPGPADTRSDAAVSAALTVTVIQPVPILWPDLVSADGPIAPWQEAVVHAEISGARLLSVSADVGDIVSRGQLLARFDSAPAEAMLVQQQAALADAEARLLEADANQTRARQLRENHTISEQDAIKAKTAALAARAQVDLAAARVKSQQLILDNTRVVAPDDGIVSARNAMLGAVSVPGLELFRLIRQNRLEWRAELTSLALTKISIGNAAEIQLPDGHVVTGIVRQIAPQLDHNSRTGIVYVALDAHNTSGARAGMFVSGSIQVGERRGIALPASAIVQRDGYEYVFLVDTENGRVSQTRVSSGRRYSGNIEIQDGISPTGTVVESGGAFLNDGDRVRIVETRTGKQSLGAAG